MKIFRIELVNCCLLLAGLQALATTRYVNGDNGTPSSPYTSWNEAATNIQQAIDVSSGGDEILVTNGVYQTGGQVIYSDHTNRIAVTKPVTVRSVNGPVVTIIRGVPGISSSGARCAYLVSGATLNGFTLTDGGTRNKAWWLPYPTYVGGGVYCESAGAVLTNCIILGNAADESAGGVYGGTLIDCELSGNYAGYHGAGAYRSSLTRCRLNSNQSWNWGGGAESCSLTSCSLSNNYAGLSGGGAFQSTLDRCAVIHNSGWWGAGVNGCTLSNCTVTGNSGWEGGGAHGSTLVNCAIVANLAGSLGGGVVGGTLVNCALTGNSAADSGGGAYEGALENCIVYFNSAPAGSNYVGGTLNWCCASPLPTVGTNNSTTDPQLADAFHLSADSACLNSGNGASASGLDIDGEAWLTSPAVGCDQFYSGTATGALNVTILASYTNVATEFTVRFTAEIVGHAAANRWDFGDGTIVSNHPWAAHAWLASGDYTVVFTAYNDSFPAGVSATVNVHVQPKVHYVSLDSTNPIAPYSDWATAATNIQDAVDAAFVGSTVVASNGVYAVGGRLVGSSSTNRLVITPRVSVESLNGPAVTAIEGHQVPGTTNGDSAVRCVWLAAEAALTGFTLTSGATAVQFTGEGPPADRTGGGAVYAESTSATVSQCILISNAAAYYAGAAVGGTLNNCLLTRNWSGDRGGGVCWSVLNNCTLVDNRASGWGGGATESTLNNCILFTNTAPDNPDHASCTLRFCCTPALADGPGNITNAPLFVDQANGDFGLQTNSPCINAGRNTYAPSTTDLGDSLRIISGTVDMGAYEFQGSGSLISYAWLQQFGLPTDGSVDLADGDGDHHNTWQEWRADTVPTNSLSVLRLTAITNAPGGMDITWQSVTTRSYFLERATNLAGPSPFLTIATNIAGQSGTTTHTDAGAAGADPCFYRAGVQE
jgi:hypothetical protein